MPERTDNLRAVGSPLVGRSAEWEALRGVIGNGGAVIIEPTGGQIVAGPLYGEEACSSMTATWACAPSASSTPVGHYSRDDVLDGLIAAGPGERGDPPLLVGLPST